MDSGEQSVVCLWGEGPVNDDASRCPPALARAIRRLRCTPGLGQRCRTPRLFLEEAAKVVGGLAELVAPCYGPDGALRVAVDLAGQVKFTTCGVQLLQKARSDHPITNVVLSAAREWSRTVGDGSTRWVLLCAGVLKRLAHAPVDLFGRPLAAAVARAGQRLASALCTRGTEANTLSPANAAARVISTSCGDDAAGVLSRLVADLFTGYTGREAQVLDNPTRRVVGASGGGLQYSRVVAGTAVRAVCRTPQLRPASGGGSRVAVLRRPLVPRSGVVEERGDGDESSSDDSSDGGGLGAPVLLSITGADLPRLRDWTEQRCDAFASRVAAAGVVLLVAQGRLPDAAVGAFREKNISVFDCMDADDARRLVDELGVDPVDPWQEGHPPVDTWAALLRGAEAVRSHPAETLVVAGPHKNFTILLLAPTPGLAAGHAELVCRALAFAAYSQRGNRWVPGAGADLLAAAAEARRSATVPAADSCVLAAVADALEDVVVTNTCNTLRSLHAARRSVAQAVGRRGERGVLSVLNLAPELWETDWGEELAEVADPTPAGLLEPSNLAADLVRSVLSTVGCLCRVSGIAHMRSGEGSSNVTVTTLV
eukprot:Hpha_TRINITY_DN19582_c0_g1::TRINITY_DN19582_c0_g1_i1::g.33646::m.33646